MTKLVAVDGPLKGKTFEVTELASIGRGDTCAVRLDGRHVSRIHARLERRQGAMVLKDNESRNGVFVNGASVKESALKADDVVEIGEHVLVFEPTGDPEKLPRARAVESLEDPFAAGELDPRLPALAAALAGEDDERELAKRLLEALLAAAPAERGFVMASEPGGPLKPLARKSPAGEEDFLISNVLGAQVLQEKRAIVAIDVRRKPPAEGARIGLLAVPLIAKGHALGLAVLEARLGPADERPTFSTADLRFAFALAAFAGQRLAQLRRLGSGSKGGHKSLPDLVTAFEKELVVGALHGAKGDLDAAAKSLGVGRAALDARLKSLGLVAPAPAAKPPEGKPPSAAGWKSVEV